MKRRPRAAKLPDYQPGEFDLPKDPDFERNRRLAAEGRAHQRRAAKREDEIPATAAIGFSPTGAAMIALAAPVLCRKCNSMHYFVVNRDGQTLCVGCDPGEPTTTNPQHPESP